MKKISRILIAIVICMQLTSCQTDYEIEKLQQLHKKYDTTMEHSKYINDFDVLDSGPVKGGTLKLFTTEPDTLNPILTKNAFTADILSFIYEGLTKLDMEQKAIPMLSDRWAVSDDGLIWDFHIRDDIKWHDGEPFTAYDVEFTIQTILIPSINSIYKPLVLNISSCIAVDSSTVRLALKKPNSFLPEMMSFPIIPRHKYIAMGVLSTKDFNHPVGTGPYRMITYTQGDKIMLTLNNDWWNVKVNEKLATEGMYLEAIQANIIESTDDSMEAFQAGDADVAGLSLSEYNKYKGRTDLTIKKYTSRDFEFISFNLKDPVFSDVYARKAVSLAIDKNRIIGEILPGDVEAAELPVMPNSWISDLKGIEPVDNYEDIDQDKEDIMNAITPEDILTIGGWKKNNNGYYKVIKGARRYLKVELMVNSNNATRIKVAQRICTQLEEAGIPAKVVSLEWNDLLKRVDSGKYNMAFMGCRVPQIPDISFMYSTGYLPETFSGNVRSANDVAGYYNAEVDEYIDMLFAENDPNKKKAIFMAIKEQVLDDSPYIGLYFLRDYMIYSKEIKGVISPNVWDEFYDMTQWYKPYSQ